MGGRESGDARPWDSLFASGAYAGFGLGLQIDRLGLYLRGRLDGSRGPHTPATLWPSALVGVEVRPVHALSFGLGVGYGGYWTAADRYVSLFFQLNVALAFDLAQPRRF